MLQHASICTYNAPRLSRQLFDFENSKCESNNKSRTFLNFRL